jgi:hypothetical protein
MRKILVASVATAAMLGSASAMAREESGKRYSVVLDGESEVPTPGDLNGSGSATVSINPGKGQLCYTLRAGGIAPPTGAHIHEAPAGATGPVVVTLLPPHKGMSQTCVSVSKELARDLIRNPENYYINVHNMYFPDGALRGQLSM